MIADLATLRRMMADQGSQRLIFKRLAPNDNSKNQPYFGPDLTAVGFIPTGEIKATATSSDKPRKSHVKFLSSLDFGWLGDDGKVCKAPHAKLIFYPQYPEVRFSGFLRGCASGPNELMDPNRRGREEGRILFLGICSDRSIVGYLVPPKSDISREIGDVGDYVSIGVFDELPVGYKAPQGDSKLQLISELRRISAKGWIESKRLLADGTVVPYRAPNGGGFTLEAEFGITPNGYAEPDFLGWEIKQYGVQNLKMPIGGRITLMTPEPNGGYYKEQGVESFLLKYGYPDTKGRDRTNFCGTHRCGERHKRTNLMLTMPGYDVQNDKITDPSLGVTLVDKKENTAASWSYSSIVDHWKKKHAQAVYVPSTRRKNLHIRYKYAANVNLGEGTGLSKILTSIATGCVIYDPGIVMYDASGTRRPIKRRSQFRITASNLDKLYDTFVTVDVAKP